MCGIAGIDHGVYTHVVSNFDETFFPNKIKLNETDLR